MSRRSTALATRVVPVDGGQAPNSYAPFVTAEVRLAWPPGTDPAVVEAAVVEACADALTQLHQTSAPDRP